MMPGEHGFRQVVKGPITHTADVSLPIRLDFIMAVFGDFGGVAMGTLNAFRPTKVANHLVTLAVVDQSVNVQSHPAFFP
jgi:hypothetical protein